MRELIIGVAELAAYAIAASLLTALGALAELNTVAYLDAGNTTFAAWLAVIGAAALYGGVVLLGWGEVIPRLRDVTNA